MVSKIKALAKKRGISLVQVEQLCGIGQRSIYNWDTNVPAVDKVKAVADLFGVTIDELMQPDEAGENE